jgi:hypothetical protein
MESSRGVRSLEHTPVDASLFMPAPRAAARTFQDLVVWRKAHELVLAVYSFTATFPKEETYGLRCKCEERQSPSQPTSPKDFVGVGKLTKRAI